MKLFLFFFMFLTFLLLLLLSEIISFFWGFLIKMFDILLISVKVFLSYLSCCNCLQTVEMNYGIKKGKWTLYLRHGRLGMWSVSIQICFSKFSSISTVFRKCLLKLLLARGFTDHKSPKKFTITHL